MERGDERPKKKRNPLFVFERRAGIWVVIEGGFGVRPASDLEVKLWRQNQRLEKKLTAAHDLYEANHG